jgi:hypothetical protein
MIEAGTKFGHYEIRYTLGAGGRVKFLVEN